MSGRGFFRNIRENKEIEDKPAEALNILIRRFMMDIKKKYDGVFEPRTLASFQRRQTHYKFLETTVLYKSSIETSSLLIFLFSYNEERKVG